jgi:iron complex outermembrane receptor protein
MAGVAGKASVRNCAGVTLMIDIKPGVIMNKPAVLGRRLALGVAAVLTAATAYAEGISDSGVIGSVIVTAQKREQNVQDVPISITTISGQLLQDTGVRDIKDLTILTPGLIVTSTSNEALTTARIRGIGTVGDNAGLESSVAVNIDGVYRPRNGVSFGDLGELERVEVLKGPQGTLFGTNTTAGVINVITKRPQNTFGANVEMTAGNFNDREAAASITGPLISDTLSARLYAAKRERDGFLDIRTGAGPRTLTDDNNRNYYTARGQLLFTPGAIFEARLIADYSKRNEDCCGAPTVYVPARTAPIVGAVNALAGGIGEGVPLNPFSRVAYSNRGTEQEIEDKGVSAELNWKFDALQLTSVTGYRKWDSANAQDPDFTTADIWYRPNDGSTFSSFKDLSEELRAAGGNDRIQWLVGGYYSKEDLDNGAAYIYGNVYRRYWSALVPAAAAGLAALGAWPANSGQVDTHTQTSKTYAVFTNDTINFTDQLDLTLGARYTKTQKDLLSHYTNRGPGVICPLPAGALCFPWVDPHFNNLTNPQSLDESKVTGTVKPTFRFTDDIMAYASYARGYKAGGFNLDRERTPVSLTAANPYVVDTDTHFAPETVDAYEVGTKTSWFNKSLLLNAAVFFQEYKGFQLNTFTGFTYVVASIPRVTSKGVDVDMLWAPPVKGLTFQGGFVYSDTRYGNFIPSDPSQILLPGQRVSFAPLWSGSLAGAYEVPLNAALKLRTNLAYKYSAHYNTGSDLNPHKAQGAYGLLDARIGVGTDVWTVEAWAQNALNKDYYQVVFDQPFQSATVPANTSPAEYKTLAGFLGQPRTFGLTLRLNF